MYKKCENCYKDGKVPNEESCKKCEDDLKRKEQECERLGEERNEYFELMAIRTEVLAKIANKLGINTAIIENKEIFNKIDQLKAENEELKKYKDVVDKLAGKTVAITSYDKPTEFCDHKDLIIQQLKVENKELKKIIERLDVPKHEVIDMDIALENEKLKAEIEELKKVSCKFKDYCTCDTEKLKQTLTEIKEIAEEYLKNYLINNGVVLLCNQILQKINAAENDHIVDVNNMVGECIPDEGKSSDHIPDVRNMVETR